MLPSIETSHFEIKLSVRDYELDSFGVVNNAVYQNYLEHTRHKFLESHGLELTAYFELGLSPVITKAEIEYRSSLKSKDDFVVSLELVVLTKPIAKNEINPKIIMTMPVTIILFIIYQENCS